MRDTITENNQLIKTKTQEVYDAGYAKGKSEGGGDGYYDVFWDSCQDYGNRTVYQRAFAGVGWNDTTFKPKYDIVPLSPDQMFYGSQVTNLKAILEEQGVILSFVNAINLNTCFGSSKITHLPEIDASNGKIKSLDSLCSNCEHLVSVELFKVTPTLTYNTTFSRNFKLEHIRFEGEIGNNISFADSPKLSGASMLDAAAHLADFSDTETGEYGNYAHTIIFSSAAWNKAVEEDEEFSIRLLYYTDVRKWNITTV